MSSFTMYTTPGAATATGSRASSTARASPTRSSTSSSTPRRPPIVEQANNGNQTVPTLVFADGTAQTNPSLAQVKEKLAALRLTPRRPAVTSRPGSGPPYQCSTSERRDRDAAGQHERAGLGLARSSPRG